MRREPYSCVTDSLTPDGRHRDGGPNADALTEALNNKVLSRWPLGSHSIWREANRTKYGICLAMPPQRLSAWRLNQIDQLVNDADELKHVCFHMPMETAMLLHRVPRWLHVASSRLSRQSAYPLRWLDALRTRAIANMGLQLWLTSRGTTTDPAIRYLAHRNGAAVVDLRVLEPDEDPTEVIEHWKSHAGGTEFPLLISGAAGDCLNVNHVLAMLATNLILLSVRRQGNIFEAVRQRMSWHQGTTQLLLDEDLTPPKLAESLLHCGAVGWHLSGSRRQLRIPTNGSETCGTKAPERMFGEVNRIPMMIHWTRGCRGPWPDQSDDEYWEEMLFCNTPDRRDALATLCRILNQQRLLATNRLTRSDQATVSFSHMTLGQFAKRRVYRRHLKRWDFDHFGIAIEPDWLREQGAGRVRYGGEADWNRMAPDQRWLFQKVGSTGGGSIDWRDEQEWRLAGDLDLKDVPTESAFVFVSRDADLEAVQRLSRWPVVRIGCGMR